MDRKRLRLKKSDYKGIVILGFMQTFLQYFFFYISLSNMSGSKGSILNASGTFFIVILSHFLFVNERLNRKKMLGCLLGAFGIILINLTGERDLSFRLTAEGFMLMAALAFAVGSVYSKVILRHMDALVLTGYQLFLGGTLLLLVGYIKGGRLVNISLIGILLFLYLIFISAVAFGVWTLLIKYNEVTKISIFNCLTPVFGTLLSGLFLSEDIYKLKNLFALLLVVAGIYLVNSYGKKREIAYKTKVK